MKPKLNYNKKFMSKVTGILNKIEKTQEPRIITIYNIDKNCGLKVGCNNFTELAYVHYSIAIGLDEFPSLNNVDDKKQDYVITLNSQQIESILIDYDETIDWHHNSLENSLYKKVFQPTLNPLKALLEK